MDSSAETLSEIDNFEIAHSINCDIHNLESYINLQSSDLTIISQNVKTVYNNLDDLKINLGHFDFHVDIIVLTE